MKHTLAERFTLYTIIAVYFLILVGGIVRSTGAGMGCPDWPKCFGSYLPPADTSSLPTNYRELYKEKRLAKNERLSKMLQALGMNELAGKVKDTPEVRAETDFDPIKARVEYLNRLVGVLIGILIIINTWLSFSYWNGNRGISFLGIAGLVLVLFQGWIGSLVVSTNLLPGFITFHMILALLLVAILLIQLFMMKKAIPQKIPANKYLIAILLILFFIQIILGTQVREDIDQLSALGFSRSQWIENLGFLFYVHRSYSLLIGLGIFWLAYKSYKNKKCNWMVITLFGIIVTEIVMGIILTYFNVPAFAQPVHLFLGTVAFGLLFYLFLITSFKQGEP